MKTNVVYLSSALDFLKNVPDESIDMIYTDPPFGTGDVQVSNRTMGGKIYSKIQYLDKHKDYLEFLVPHLVEMHRVLKPTGTMYLHLDWRWVHYAKVECDGIFGYDNFMNHVVWSYNFGGRGKDRWPTKHDDILVYAKEMGRHTFNQKDVDRIPYVAPELQYLRRTKEEAEKRIALGQIPTDVWDIPIVGTASKERLGYPNQKPVKLIRRAILASSNPGEVILDPFVGCGTTAAAAIDSGREFVVCDKKQEAFNMMKQRFSSHKVEFVE